MPLRFAAFVSLAVLALAVSTASTASVAGTPGLVHRGGTTTISIVTSAPHHACTLTIHYANGRVQNGGRRLVRGQRANWTVHIPLKAAIGVASWTVRCDTLLRAGGFIVLDSLSTTKAPRVVVDKQGYSQRPDKNDPGSAFSYGLILRNTSPNEDAHNVYVIVNMVAADGELVGTKTRTVSLIAAGTSFAFGDNLPLRTQTGVDHLEVTVRVGAHQPASPHPMPDFANVKILPGTFDPGWVAEVDGEIVNDTSKQTLTSARLSIVLLDAAGTPVGGSTGSTFSPLPSGTRIVFLVQNGFTAVPLDRAATAIVSVEPTYSTG